MDHQNIGDIVAFQEREHEKIGPAQRRLEVFSALIGRPLYLASLLSLVAVALQQPTDTARVLSALESRGVEKDGQQLSQRSPQR